MCVRTGASNIITWASPIYYVYTYSRSARHVSFSLSLSLSLSLFVMKKRNA
jgi:hypothetical protein